MEGYAPHSDLITNLEQLESLFKEPLQTSVRKETKHLTAAYRKMIEASPFFAIATIGPEGLDCSPRGDPAGFVQMPDEKTIVLPERRGNNRIDSLRNIVRDPRIALLFLIPGIAETLRVNGRAVLSRNSQLCESLAMEGKAPAVVIIVEIGSVYFQCARAIYRSKLWDPALFRSHGDLPTPGKMLADATAGETGGEAYDDGLAERQKSTLY